MANLKDLIVNGASRFIGKVYSSGGFVGDLEGTASNASKVNNLTVQTAVPSGAVFTDTKVTAVGNHYTPSGGSTTSASGGTLTDIANSSTGAQVVTGVTKDSAGHVTGVTSVALKATNTTYESKAAASGGTAVSLVTTGEKYTWNSKTSNTGTVTSVAIKMNGSQVGSAITSSGTIDLGTVITSHQSIAGKMNTSNPTGTGYLSINRKASTTVGNYSSAVGLNPTASAEASHAEGKNTTASGYAAHAEGEETTASREYSHAEGLGTTAGGHASHAEGANSTVGADSTYGGHAEGNSTQVTGSFGAHAEGSATIAKGNACHVEGDNTIAATDCQHVEGKWNVEDTGKKYAHIIGGGSSGARKNIHTVDWSGNAEYTGYVKVSNAVTLQYSTTTECLEFKF